MIEEESEQRISEFHPTIEKDVLEVPRLGFNMPY